MLGALGSRLWKTAQGLVQGQPVAPSPAAPAPTPEPPSAVDPATLDPDYGMYPQPPPSIAAVGLDFVLSQHTEAIAKIKSRATLKGNDWDRLYMPVIRNFASFVHLLPASESHHHSTSGGLLSHCLEVAFLTMREGYSHAQPIENYPSQNRELSYRFPFACFLAGLLHDIGKPITDMTVTADGGDLCWDPHFESLADWLSRYKVQRYFVWHVKGRRNQHKAYSSVALAYIVKEEARHFLTSSGGNLFQDVIAAINADTMPALPGIGQYVFKADAASCDEDMLRPETIARTHKTPPSAGAHHFHSITQAIQNGTWEANRRGGPVWFVNGSLFIEWPEAYPTIRKYIPKRIWLPPGSLACLNALGDRQYLQPGAPDRPYMYLVVPETCEAAGDVVPKKCIALETTKTKALFPDGLPPSIGGRVAMGKGAEPGGSEVPAAVAPPAAAPPRDQAAAAAPVSPAAPAAPKPPPARMPHPAAPASAHASPPEAPPDLDYLDVPPRDDGPPPMPEEYMRALGDDEWPASPRGQPPPSKPSAPPPKPAPPPQATKAAPPSTPPSPPPREVKSQPSLPADVNNDTLSARKWFQMQEGLLHEELLTIADKVINQPKGPMAQMLAVKGGLVVFAYPDLPKAIRGDGWRQLMGEYSKAGLLYSGHPDEAPVRNDYGFSSAVVLDQETSRKFLAVLGAFSLQDVTKIDPKRRSVAPPAKGGDLDLFQAREAAGRNPNAAKQALSAITAPVAAPAATPEPPAVDESKPDPIAAAMNNIGKPKASTAAPAPSAPKAPAPPAPKQDIDPAEVGLAAPPKVSAVVVAPPTLIDASLPSKWDSALVKTVFQHLYAAYKERPDLFQPSTSVPDHIEAADTDLAELLTDQFIGTALPQGFPPTKPNRRQMIFDWVSLRGETGIFIGKKRVSAQPSLDSAGAPVPKSVVFNKAYLNAR